MKRKKEDDEKNQEQWLFLNIMWEDSNIDSNTITNSRNAMISD